MSRFATAITIPVTNAARQENSRRSLKITDMEGSPFPPHASSPYQAEGLPSVLYPTFLTLVEGPLSKVRGLAFVNKAGSVGWRTVRLFPSFFRLRLLLLLLDHRSRGVGYPRVERRFMLSRQTYPYTRHFD